MSKPIMAEVVIEDRILNTEEQIFYGTLIEAYRKWKKYNSEHPFGPEGVLRYEQPDGTMVVWGTGGHYTYKEVLR